MADEQVAIAAPEEFYVLIIRQALLYGHNGKLPAVEFLNAVGEAQPAEIVLVVGHITDSGLQQAFIYTVAESIVTLDGLRFCRQPSGQ